MAELHVGNYGLDVFIELFKLMYNAGYRVHSKEANLQCGPGCEEYAWIHKDFLFTNRTHPAVE